MQHRLCLPAAPSACSSHASRGAASHPIPAAPVSSHFKRLEAHNPIIPKPSTYLTCPFPLCAFVPLQPLEALNPIIQNPAFNAARPLWVEVLNKLKPLLMSIYFGGDHVVWAQQVGMAGERRGCRCCPLSGLRSWPLSLLS